MKLHCPWHDDATPSLELYSDGWVHCFVCGAHRPYSAYSHMVGGGEDLPPASLPPPKPKEDIKASIERIKALPKMRIRGLELHADARGYYILWPNENYYLFRAYEGPTRYVGPSGHSRPLFMARYEASTRPLLVVEGEINALSVAEATHYDVVSPGGAQTFEAQTSAIAVLCRAGPMYIIVDEDKPGAEACIKLSSALRKHHIYAKCILMKKKKHGGRGDANEILVNEGPVALKAEIERLCV